MCVTKRFGGKSEEQMLRAGVKEARAKELRIWIDVKKHNERHKRYRARRREQEEERNRELANVRMFYGVMLDRCRLLRNDEDLQGPA